MKAPINQYIFLWQLQPVTFEIHDLCEEMGASNPTPDEVLQFIQQHKKRAFTELALRRILKERAEIIEEYHSDHYYYPQTDEEYNTTLMNREIIRQRARERKERIKQRARRQEQALKQQSANTPAKTDN